MARMERFDVCVAGGGVAGAALAAFLGSSNLRVAVIEKTLAEQDRIIGELLQPGGVEMLERMNLGHVLEGFDAQLIDGYALFMNGEDFEIPYPKQYGQTCCGRGLRNGRFVQKMREYAFSQSNVTVFEGSVTELIEEGDEVKGVIYRPKGEENTIELNAALTVISDGIFSAFRSRLSKVEKKVSGHFLGLVLRNCKLPYPQHGHVIITSGSPVLVYPISTNETRMLIDFPGEEPPKKGEELTRFLNNHIGPCLPKCMLSSFNEAVKEGRFKVMPNHQMPAKPVIKPGAVLLGDSLNMRHPLTGGGMTVAFTDVYLLGTQLMKPGVFSCETSVHTAVKTFYKNRRSKTSSINILADALYGVMRNEDLKQACFNYLKRGGAYMGEPVSILSAVSRDVRMLIRHFFAVAVYGVRRLIFPVPTYSRVKRSYRMLADAVRIIHPLLRNERML